MKNRFEKILVIVQTGVSAILLLAILFIWIVMHVLKQGFNDAQIYYANIYASIPVGILLITAIILWIRLKKK